jgi:hypothetical protein
VHEGCEMSYNYTGYGAWVEYNGWRYKDVHHIKLRNGEVLNFMHPNGNSWHPDVGHDGSISGRTISDQDVAEICLVPDDEILAVESFRQTGAERVECNELLHGHVMKVRV